MEPGYTLCFAAQWLGSREIIFDSVKVSGKVGLIKHAHRLLDEADVVCHYNGQNFDIPTLRGEFMARRLKPPSPFAQVDLLKVARTVRIPSRKLDYFARMLGLGGKIEHKGMDLWRDCMAGDAAAWRTMERYNKQDVRLLARLYKELAPWITSVPHDPSNCQHERVQARGVARTKQGVYRRFQCNDCGAWIRNRTAESYANYVRLAV